MTPRDDYDTYDDWSKLIDEFCAQQELEWEEEQPCFWCGGEGEVWETDCSGAQILVPCRDCTGPIRMPPIPRSP